MSRWVDHLRVRARLLYRKTGPTPGETDGSSGRVRGLIGFGIGLLLFGAALLAIFRGGADLSDAWTHARSAPWWLVAAVIVLPVLNWLVISLSFHILHNHDGRVGRTEMASLIASAWLLNYLPLKVGMLGRLAYHKRVNGIPFRKSVRVLVVSVTLSGLAIGVLIGIAALVRLTAGRVGPEWTWVWCVPVPVGLLVAAWVLRGTNGWAWRIALAGFCKYLDMMIWIGRYAAAFALVGSPLGFEASLIVAAVSQIALLIPISGNGLGIREWGVRAVTDPVGLLADVVNRAAELVVSVPLGLAGSAYAARRLANHSADRDAA